MKKEILEKIFEIIGMTFLINKDKSKRHIAFDYMPLSQRFSLIVYHKGATESRFIDTEVLQVDLSKKTALEQLMVILERLKEIAEVKTKCQKN